MWGCFGLCAARMRWAYWYGLNEAGSSAGVVQPTGSADRSTTFRPCRPATAFDFPSRLARGRATIMPHAIIRRANGRRHGVDFGDAPVRVEIYASGETVEIFIEADFETLPEERRRFALRASQHSTPPVQRSQRRSAKGQRSSARILERRILIWPLIVRAQNAVEVRQP